MVVGRATSFWAALCMGLPYALADALLLERLRGVSAGAHVFSACSASQARMSPTRQAVTLGPILRGAGNVPALTQRHSVEAEAGMMGVGLLGFWTSSASRRNALSGSWSNGMGGVDISRYRVGCDGVNVETCPPAE